MRTFLSQLPAAKWSLAELKRMLEMLSSGGLLTGMSLLRSPCVGFADEAAGCCAPKSDMLPVGEVADRLVPLMERLL